MGEKTVEFIYSETTRRPKRLENNVFVLYNPKGIRLMPREKHKIDMKIKIRLSEDLIGCCTLLQTFTENEVKLLNSQHISSETNKANFRQNVALPWTLSLEIFNQNTNTIIRLNKRQELGFFHILNNRGEEIRHVYRKEETK